MDAQASPSRSISSHLRGALRACRGAWSRMRRGSRSTSRCRRCASPAANRSMAKASVRRAGRNCRSSRRRYCPRLGIPFVYDPGPELLSMEAIANPPAYERARAAVRYDDVAAHAGACAEIPGPHGSRARDGPLDGAGGPGAARRGRRAGSGAAALAARLEPPLQPVRRAGAGDRAANRGQAGLRGAAADAADPAADRPVAVAARQQCAGRVQGGAGSQPPRSRAAAWS